MTFAHPLRRAVEATVAAALLLLCLPAIAAAALLSVATYRAWPFFVQDRVGRDGRSFRLVKVRTLPPTTDAYADKYSLGAVAPPLMVTLRRLHLDELPQLWHVVTGDMTFVGPRPEMPNLHARLPRRFADERVTATPGLTGLWQISPHCTQLIGERPEYDRLYLQHRTVPFDLWILWRTALKMATGRTTHLYEVPPRAITAAPAPLLRFEVVEAAPSGTWLDLRSGLGGTESLALATAAELTSVAD
jgi:lipopolysaccharide/colanic/teichoic acid biosynthesis glycosyltransferase